MVKRSLVTALCFCFIGVGVGELKAEEKQCLPGTGVEKQAAELMAVVNKKNCPDLGKLKFICLSVGDRKGDSDPDSDFAFLYEREIAEAACVDIENDDEDEMNKKIRDMWPKMEDAMLCNNSSVNSQSVMKYAITQKFKRFISQAAREWKVDLNKVGKDKMTVLDFLEKEIERSKNSPNLKELNEYKKILIDAGAKRSVELDKKK